MTYSLLLLNRRTGDLGVAVASGSVAVGARVPWARYGVGAVATQAYTNPALGPLILELMSRGYSAAEALEDAIRRDEAREYRQVAVVGVDGDVALFTGSWAPRPICEWVDEDGDIVAAAVGNLVAREEVCRLAVEAALASPGWLPEKLLAGLDAGHRAGGDARGDRSAALLVVGHTRYLPWYDRLLDLRVDLSVDPVRRLEELFEATSHE